VECIVLYIHVDRPIYVAFLTEYAKQKRFQNALLVAQSDLEVSRKWLSKDVEDSFVCYLFSRLLRAFAYI